MRKKWKDLETGGTILVQHVVISNNCYYIYLCKQLIPINILFFLQ